MSKHKNRTPLPDLTPCTCGSTSISRENWRDMNKIYECNSCGRKVWADTWRAAITAWNNGKEGQQWL